MVVVGRSSSSSSSYKVVFKAVDDDDDDDVSFRQCTLFLLFVGGKMEKGKKAKTKKTSSYSLKYETLTNLLKGGV